MLRRSAPLALTAVVVLAMASGCSAQPAPVETTPGFASDEQAFAAAEETYRAYIDALNTQRTDPESGTDANDFLIGQALEAELTSTTGLTARGLTVAGETRVRSAKQAVVDADAREVSIEVCLDISATTVHNSAGADVTPAERVDFVSLDVHLLASGRNLLISQSVASEEQAC